MRRREVSPLIEDLKQNHFNIWKRAQILNSIAAQTIVDGLKSYGRVKESALAETKSFLMEAIKDHIELDTTSDPDQIWQKLIGKTEMELKKANLHNKRSGSQDENCRNRKRVCNRDGQVASIQRDTLDSCSSLSTASTNLPEVSGPESSSTDRNTAISLTMSTATERQQGARATHNCDMHADPVGPSPGVEPWYKGADRVGPWYGRANSIGAHLGTGLWYKNADPVGQSSHEQLKPNSNDPQLYDGTDINEYSSADTPRGF